MTEQMGSSMKVYELAKELGVDSISLLDRLANLNIKVKNHMSDLGEEELKIARSSLAGGGQNAKTAPSKTGSAVVRKSKSATTPSAASASTASTPNGLTSTAAKSAAPRKKKASDAAPAALATTTSPAAEAAPTSTVIRRRSRSDENGTTTTTTTTTSSMTSPASTNPKSGLFEKEAEAAAHPIETKEHAETLPHESSVEESVSQSQEFTHSEDSNVHEKTEKENETLEAVSSIETTPSEAETPVVAAPPTATTTTTTTTVVEPPKRTPVTLPPRPVAPRKSFLKIVEHAPVVKPRIISQAPPPPAARPGGGITPAGRPTFNPNGIGTTNGPGGMRGTTQTQDKDGFRIVKMTKENLDQMVEDENKKGKARLEGEIKPEDVRFADYRKKEVVFLPKRKKLPMGKTLNRTEKTVAAAHKRVVEMGDTITVSEFASQMSLKGTDVVKKLMMMGQMVTINQSIDFDTASLVAAEFKFEVKNVAFKENEVLNKAVDLESDLVARPPVVTIMGHVDHGKTSLLDAIRKASVAKGEAGGITQHIGAYTVSQNGQLITFIDTPGHAAFTAMRARGANVTDIVILVVAADDGVMPQTREALSHAKAAGVPIIVAMNKIDKPGANPEKIKQQLSELDLLAEEWGGQTMFVPVSAHTKSGIPELLEAILLQSEVLDLKANPKVRAEGSVIEARLERGRGPVATVLVKRGTLKIGEYITSGQFSGRVKALTDHNGANIKTVTPGMAAEVLGFEGLPSAGEKFDCVEDDAAARKLIDNRKMIALQERQAQQKVSLNDLFAKLQNGGLKELSLILKADVSGSVEAVRDSLLKLSNDQVTIKVLFAAPGGITESDVMLATASNAIILGFNVRPETKARQLAEASHVEIKCYSIIYELIDDIKLSMTGILDKKKVEKFLGRAEVRQTFTAPKIGVIAGSYIIDGKVVRGANVRLLRDSRIIFDGKMSSLRRFKDDAKEVAEGFECGIGIENFNDIKVGDLIEAYEVTMVTPDLNPATNN